MDTAHTVPTPDTVRIGRHGLAGRALVVLLVAAVAFTGLATTAPAAEAYTTPTVSCSQISGEVGISRSDRWQYVYLYRWNAQQGRWDTVAQRQISPFEGVRFTGVQSPRVDLLYTARVYHWHGTHGWVEQGRPLHITQTRSLTSSHSRTHCTVLAG